MSNSFRICFLSILTFLSFDNSVNAQDFEKVVIGNQTWMKKNLDVTTYRNGDSIPEVQNPRKWANLKTGAWCYYENQTKNGIEYGKLYNWYAINDPRGLAPEGWHIPSDDEWVDLSDYLGGQYLAGGKLKDVSLWNKTNVGADNSSGFSGLPGGFRSDDGHFTLIGTNGRWWSSTEAEKGYVWTCYLYNSYIDLGFSKCLKKWGQSVRCIKD